MLLEQLLFVLANKKKELKEQEEKLRNLQEEVTMLEVLVDVLKEKEKAATISPPPT